MTRLLRITLCAALVALVAAGPLEAYSWFYTAFGGPLRWSAGFMDLRLSASDFKAGSVERASLEAAVAAWNRGPADFEFELLYDDTNPSPGNGQSETWFTTNEYILSGGAAITHMYSWWGLMTEADVVFDAAWSWSFSESKSDQLAYGGSSWSFASTAIHELGHALGLGHEDGTYNVLGVSQTHASTNGYLARRTPGENATDGAVDLYGLASDMPEDVGVTHWVYDGSWLDYSQHKRSEMFGTDNKELPVFHEDFEPVYLVSRGQTVKVEFGFENNGSTLQQPQTGYYLSTNDYVSTWDTLLATAAPSLGRNTVYQRSQTLIIPSWVNVGQTYYLGAVVDRTGTIPESDESNNATYVAIQIVG